MAELEEKLNAILNDPQAMGQILSAAKALSGSAEEDDPPPSRDEERSGTEAGGDLFSTLGQLDPRVIQIGMRLLSEYTADDDRKTALLAALKPFLRPERQAKVDQAVKIARLSKVIHTAFRLFQTGGEETEEDV